MLRVLEGANHQRCLPQEQEGKAKKVKGRGEHTLLTQQLPHRRLDHRRPLDPNLPPVVHLKCEVDGSELREEAQFLRGVDLAGVGREVGGLGAAGCGLGEYGEQRREKMRGGKVGRESEEGRERVTNRPI